MERLSFCSMTMLEIQKRGGMTKEGGEEKQRRTTFSSASFSVSFFLGLSTRITTERAASHIWEFCGQTTGYQTSQHKRGRKGGERETGGERGPTGVSRN